MPLISFLPFRSQVLEGLKDTNAISIRDPISLKALNALRRTEGHGHDERYEV